MCRARYRTNLLARVDVNEDGHWSLFSLRRLQCGFGTPQLSGTIAIFSCSESRRIDIWDGRYAQITSGNDALAGNRFCFASISNAGRISVAARRPCGQHRSDRSGRAWLGPQAWLGARPRLSSVRLEPRPQGGLARLWLPARSLEEGLVLSPSHPLRRSISRTDQGIGLDFLRIVITFGTNALYGRSVDFVNTWGSAAVRVS
jgi:hypothetical protein